MVTTSTDRRAVDCPHRSSHRHGTRDAYIADHCRCPSCTAANTRWNNQRRRDLAMNRWKPYVDGGAVREHLLLLRKAGIGIDRIVGRSGVSRSPCNDCSPRPVTPATPAAESAPMSPSD